MAKVKAKTVKIDRVVAIHEAGHAVARYLTADDLGYTTDTAISYIDVAPGTSVGPSIDGTMSLRLQATTYGPMLSKEIQAVAFRQFGDISTAKPTMENVEDAIVKARSEGADIFRWLRARMLITVFGAAAEAKYFGKSFEEVWGSYETEADMRDSVHDCLLAGVTDEEAILTFIDEAKEKATTLIDLPEIWRAVIAIADSLPASGRFDGKKAAMIIRTAMAPS